MLEDLERQVCTFICMFIRFCPFGFYGGDFDVLFKCVIPTHRQTVHSVITWIVTGDSG